MNNKTFIFVLFGIIISVVLVNAIPLIDFISPPTPLNATTQNSTSVIANLSISGVNLSSLIWNWNGTNFTMYNDSLVLMMNFDNLTILGDNSTYVTDASKYSNNGTIYGGAVWNISGKYGGAMQFEGSSVLLNLSSEISLSGPWTICTWTMFPLTSSSSGWRTLTRGSDNDHHIIVNTTGYLGMYDNDDGGGSVVCSPAIDTDNYAGWYHLCAIGSGTQTIFYINSQNVCNSSTKGDGLLRYIGNYQGQGQDWGAPLDEFRVYNRSLSSSEIQQLYMSNLQKYNQTQWYLYVNQSKNATAGLDVANYTYFASAKDTAGNENITETRIITIIPDTTAPAVIIGKNATQVEFGTGIININWSTADNIAISSSIFNITYPNGSVLLSSTANSGAVNLTSLNLSVLGIYNINLWANDTTNNPNSTSTSFSVNDTILPSINFTFPTPNNGSSQTGTSIYVNISSNDSSAHYVVNNFDNSLVGWWRFENNSNAISNSTWTGDENGKNNGTVSGATYNTTGKFGGDYMFDGVNDWINASNSLSLNFSNGTTISISLWAKRPASTTDWKPMLTKGAGTDLRNYELTYSGSGLNSGANKLSFYFRDSANTRWDGFASSATYTDSNWHHITLIHQFGNSTSTILYMDGAAISASWVDGNGNDTPLTTPGSLGIGRGGSGASEYFNGSIDEVMIFNRSLSSQEVLALYNATANQYYNNFTNLAVGNHTFKAYAVDAVGNKNQTEERIVNITSSADTIYPIFSNNITSIANNSQYNPSNNYQFNITIANTNGTAGIEFNGTNYTMSNVSSVFNKTFGNLGVGTYPYYFWSYGNGTSHLYNKTGAYSYVVIQNSTYILGLSATTPITYGTSTDFASHESGCPSGATCNLNITDGIFSAGAISANYSFAGNQNYSGSSAVFTITINKAVPMGAITNSTSLNLMYPASIAIGLSETNLGDGDVNYKIYRDNIDKGTGETITLGAGNYNYILNTTGGQNYTSNSSMDAKTLIVNKNTSAKTSLTFDKTSPQSYPNSITPICSIVAGQGTPVLSLNGTIITSGVPITLGVATWQFNCSLADNGNYSYAENVTNFQITQNNSYVLNMNINPSWNVNYGTQTNVSGANCPSQLTCNLYNNASGLVANGINLTLEAGNYNFTYNTTGNANYSYKGVSNILTVSQSNGYTNLSLNGIENNLTINYSQQINITASNPYGILTIYKDGVDITSTNGLNRTYSSGYYNITAYSSGNQNYTSSYKTFWLNITKSAPILTILLNGINENLTIVYPQQINISTSSNAGTVGLDKDNINYLSNNGLNITLGVGSYIFRVNITGNENYSDVGYSYYNITINKAVQSITPLLNGINANLTLTYPQQINASYSGANSTALSIKINNTQINIAQNYTWQTGSWVVNYSAAGNENYSSYEVYLNFTINQGAGLVNGTINGTASNFTAYNGTTNQNIMINATNITGYGTGKIYINGSLFNSGIMSLFNITNLSLGFYNITFIYDGNENYSSDAKVLWVNITLAPCAVQLQNTPWGDWADSGSCLANNSQIQVRNLTQYDGNICGEVENETIYEYQEVACDFCTPSLVNTTWSSWQNLICVNVQMNQSRFKVQYDSNTCGEIANVTYYEYQLIDPIYQNTSWTGWLETTECRANNTVIQERNLTQYDSNTCGENNTHFEYREVACDFCTPNMQNTSWSSWQNQEMCLVNDTQIQNRSKTEYDTNSCEEILNSTYWEYQSITCDFCTPSLVNTTWSNWQNLSCINNQMNQSRFKVQYDSNTCGEIANVTNYEYQKVYDCDLEDIDNDGIPDVKDNLEGNSSSPTVSGISNLNVTISGNSTYGSYNNTQEVIFKDSSSKILNFTHNFSASELDLSKIILIKSTNSIIVNLSEQLQLNYNKTLYLNDNNFVFLCVKDADISNANEISYGCNSTNETDFTACLGGNATINGISCINQESIIAVSSLRHSGVVGRQAPTASNPGGSSGGGGGGGIVKPECESDKACKEGYSCYNNKCVKLFDVEILKVEPLTENLNFPLTYLIKGMADIKGDVIIKFWLERENKEIMLGQDTIYLGSFEEKTKSTNLNLPSSILNGDYELHVQVNFSI